MGLALMLSLLSVDALAVQADRQVAPPQVLIDSGLLHADAEEDGQLAAMTWQQVVRAIKPTPWPKAQAKPVLGLSPVAADLLRQAEELRQRGEVFRAIQVLREARVLEPQHPKVARALGLTYAESGNLTRAASLLRDIAAADRDDAEVLLTLARHSAQSEPIEQVFADCLALEKVAGGKVLADYSRSIALHRLGYTAAATDRLASAIQAINKVQENDDLKLDDRVQRELGVVKTMSPRLSVQLGDLYLQSGQYDKAAKAYAAVKIEDPTARHMLVARRIYLALLTDSQDDAVDQAITLLGSDDVMPEDAQLIAYLVDQGLPAETIALRLNSLLEKQVVLPRLVALAMVADKAVVLEQISAWLSREPLTPARLEQAVALVQFDDDDPADAKPLTDLLVMLAGRIEQTPDQALTLARAAVRKINAPVTLLRAMQSDAFANTESDYHQLIAAVTFEATGRRQDAMGRYLALNASNDQLSKQIQRPTVRLLLAMGRGEDALALIGEPDIESDWKTLELSLRAMAAAGDARQGLSIIDRYIKEHGKELESDVLRIEMIAMMGQPQEACNLLLRLISSHPEKESLYHLGMNLAYDYRAFFSRMDDYDRMRRAFLARLLSNLPDSALSRIGMAQNIKSNPARIDEAEELLLKVLEEDPGEATAMSLLVDLYDERGDEVSAKAMHERYAKAIGPGISRAVVIAERAVEQGKMQRAVEVIEQTLELEKQGVLPGREMTGNDASMLLHQLEAADPDRDTDDLYLAMVRRFPNDAGLNNALGYRWAVQNKNLNQAKAMIERALEQEPMNHSLLDSLAWVHYKLGEFEAAYNTQSRALMVLEATIARFGDEEQMGATIAILNDHMGDILYKLEDPRKALDRWRLAGKQDYSEQDKLMDPELRTLQARLKAKVDAMANEQPVPVAQVPGRESHGPEGHPADIEPREGPAEP
jgi:tetratricopeptide (TPR) repeat protein